MPLNICEYINMNYCANLFLSKHWLVLCERLFQCLSWLCYWISVRRKGDTIVTLWWIFPNIGRSFALSCCCWIDIIEHFKWTLCFRVSQQTIFSCVLFNLSWLSSDNRLELLFTRIYALWPIVVRCLIITRALIRTLIARALIRLIFWSMIQRL